MEVYHMPDLIEKIREKNPYFSLEYRGIDEYSTYWDVKTVLDNSAFLQNELDTIQLNGIDSLSEYVTYLCLKKLESLQEMIPTLKNDEDKRLLGLISELAKQRVDCVNNGMLIRFINSNFKEIFNEEQHSKALPQITLHLMVSFQNGISQEAFHYIVDHYNYLLLQNFQAFRKRFEKEPVMFGRLFQRKDLEEMRELRLDCVFPIFAAIWNGSNVKLKSIIAPIMERVFSDAKVLAETETAEDDRNILITERLFRKVYDFSKKIKHPSANELCIYQKRLQKQMELHLTKYGQKFSYSIPVEKLMRLLKATPNWQIAMLQLTHSHKRKQDELECISRLGFPSKGKQGLMDMVSSNIPSDDYFTLSHQDTLRINIEVGAATIHAMWHDEELFPECLHWYIAFLDFIDEQIGSTENLGEDIKTLFEMLQPVIPSDDIGKESLRPLCYGAALFICSLIEKLLRSVYIYLLKDKIYIPLTSATLGSLLSSHNEEMTNIFGEDHLKNLAFFLCTVGDKKIGWNIRNRLAHWTEMSKHSLNSKLVAQLLYLYTDVINTVFWYFYCKDENSKEDPSE